MHKQLLTDAQLLRLALRWVYDSSCPPAVSNKSGKPIGPYSRAQQLVNFLRDFGPSGSETAAIFFEFVTDITGGSIVYENESSTEYYLVFATEEEQLAFVLRWT